MTRDERKLYMVKYRLLKKSYERRSDISKYLETNILIDERTMVIKIKRCQRNRCNKVLTMTEKLYGNYCQRHSIGQTPNINNINKLFLGIWL